MVEYGVAAKEWDEFTTIQVIEDQFKGLDR
jgi:hypothetical protein